MMTMQYLLILVRHAETEFNVKGLIQGHNDSPLTANGVKRAENLAEWLSPVSFTHVVTSDLQRAVRTSEIVLSRNKAAKSDSSKITVVRDEKIRERNFSHWSGKAFRELYTEATRCGATYPNFAPPGVEPLIHLRKRASEYFGTFSHKLATSSNLQPVSLSPEALARLGLDPSFEASKMAANVLMVVHGGIIRELLADISGRNLIKGGLPDAAKKLAGNCFYSTIIVTVNAPGFSSELPINCVNDIRMVTANAKPPDHNPAPAAVSNHENKDKE